MSFISLYIAFLVGVIAGMFLSNAFCIFHDMDIDITDD